MSGTDNLREKDYYKDKIVEMVSIIENTADLQMLYGMAKAAYNDSEIRKAEEE